MGASKFLEIGQRDPVCAVDSIIIVTLMSLLRKLKKSKCVMDGRGNSCALGGTPLCGRKSTILPKKA